MLEQIARLETGDQRRKNAARADDEKRFDLSTGSDFPEEKKPSDDRDPHANDADAAARYH
jgi:hypothetical protein